MTLLIYRTSGEIDSPEKKARVDAARARFDDADADLKVRRFGAPVAAPPRADVPTTMPLVYDTFWAAASDEVDTLGVASADRRGTALYCAQPVSVRDFVERVKRGKKTKKQKKNNSKK